MNIIWLTPEIPYPPIGGRNGVFNRIVQLSKYNNIFLFSIAYNTTEMNLRDEMLKYCEEVYYYNRNSNKAMNMLKSLFLPYSVASRTIKDINNGINRLISEIKIDQIIVDFPNMALNIRKVNTYGIKCSLNQHNTEFLRMREMYNIKSLPFIKRVAYLLESYRLELYEKNVYYSNLFDSVTFFSKKDYIYFKKRWSRCKSRLQVFPLGSNRVDYRQESKDINHNTFLFVGRLDSIAVTNVEAIIWFCRNVLPVIEQEIDVKIIIAGSNPCKEVECLKNRNVEIIPNYESLASVYSLADYVVLPLKSGGGVKGKLLEAAAFGKVIISTSHGIEGTDFCPNEHVLFGDTALDFARACIKAVTDRAQANLIAKAANDLFLQKYVWDNICKEYNDYLLASQINK